MSVRSRIEALIEHWQTQRGREFSAVGLDEMAFRASRKPLTELPPRCLQAALYVDAYSRVLKLLDAEPPEVPAATEPRWDAPAYWDDDRLWSPIG